MKSIFLNWDNKQLLFVFIITIRLNTEAQSSNSNISIGYLPVNSNFSKLTSSTTPLTNTDNANDIILFFSENTTRTVNSSSIHPNSTDLPNISPNSNIRNPNEIFIDNTGTVQDVFNTMNATILSENSTRTITLIELLHNTTNDSSVKVNESAQEITNASISATIITIHTINNTTQPSTNTTVTTTRIISMASGNNSQSSIENNTAFTRLTSTLVNLINSIQLNQMNLSSLLNSTSSFNSSETINTSTTTTFSVLNTNFTLPSVRNISIATTDTVKISNSSTNTADKNFFASILPSLNSISNQLNNTYYSSNATVTTLSPTVNNTASSNLASNLSLPNDIVANITRNESSSNLELTLPSLGIIQQTTGIFQLMSSSLNLTNKTILPSVNDTLTSTLSTGAPIFSTNGINWQIASTPSLNSSAMSLLNQNQTLEIDNSLTVASSESEVTMLPSIVTILSNTNLSAFPYVTETPISTASLPIKSESQTTQQSVSASSPMPSALELSTDYLLFTSNVTQTSNTIQLTNNTLPPILSSLNQLNPDLASELVSTQTRSQPDTLPTTPTALAIQHTLNTFLPMSNVPTIFNQDTPSTSNGSSTTNLNNIVTPASTETPLSLQNNFNQSSTQPLNNTEGTLSLNSLQPPLSPATLPEIPGSIPPATTSVSLPNETFLVLLNTTLVPVLSNSLPTILTPVTMQEMPSSLPPITSSSNRANESLLIPMNSTEGGAPPLESLPTGLGFATMQEAFSTLPSIISSTNSSNESLPPSLINTEGAMPFISSPPTLLSSTIEATPGTIPTGSQSTNLSNESFPLLLSTAQAPILFNSIPTLLTSAIMPQTPSSLPPMTLSSNPSNESLPLLVNSTEGSLSLEPSSIGLVSATIQEAPITLASIMSSASPSNESLSVSQNATEGAVSFGSLLTLLMSATTPQTPSTLLPTISFSSPSNGNLSAPENSTEGSIPLESLPTGLASTTINEALSTLSLIAPSANISKESLPPSMNITEEGGASFESLPTGLPSVTLQGATSTLSPITLSGSGFNESLSSLLMSTTGAVPVESLSTLLTLSTMEETTSTITPIINSENVSNETFEVVLNSTEASVSPSSLLTLLASATVQPMLDTFSSVRMSTSTSHESSSLPANSTEGGAPMESLPTGSTSVTTQKTPFTLPTITSSTNPSNESSSLSVNSTVGPASLQSLLTVLSAFTMQETPSTPPFVTTSAVNTQSDTVKNLSNAPTSIPIPASAPNDVSSSTVPLTTIGNSATGYTEVIRQSSMPVQSVGSTLVEAHPTGTVNTNSGIDTSENPSVAVEVTGATSFSTVSLLARLITSPPLGSAETKLVTPSTQSLFSSEELTTSNEYSTNSRASNLPLLLSTLISHSQVTASSLGVELIGSEMPLTSSLATMYSTPISVTEPTTFSQPLFNYSAVFSSSISSTISSISNTNAEIVERSSTVATNINAINFISTSQQIPTSSENVATMINSISLETSPIVMSSIQSSSIMPLTSANSHSNDVTSVVSETISNTLGSVSSISINTQQNTLNTISLSNTSMSQTNSASIMSETVVTPTISTSLPSLNSISNEFSASSSNTGGTTGIVNSSPSTATSILLTSISTSSSSAVNSITSSMTTETTSYSSSLSSSLETATSTQMISTSTITGSGTTLLSLLSTTSSLLISNQTSTIPSMISSIAFTTQINPNTTNITTSNDCVFPFLYLGQWYEKCISDILNDSWCSLTANFDRDRQWKYCRAARVKTTGGTGNGNDCVFPFVYQGTSFSTCIYRTVAIGTTQSFSLFCSVTSNLDQHGLWGYCLDYSSCYFPFIYNGITYSDCISGAQSARWCSTTANFDRNQMWTNCPVTCNGYPQQDANSVGFRLLSNQRPCVFKKSIAHDTGFVLKYYALPTCQLEPLCRANYVPLFKQIICQEDGRYNYPRAICLPNQ